MAKFIDYCMRNKTFKGPQIRRQVFKLLSTFLNQISRKLKKNSRFSHPVAMKGKSSGHVTPPTTSCCPRFSFLVVVVVVAVSSRLSFAVISRVKPLIAQV